MTADDEVSQLGSSSQESSFESKLRMVEQSLRSDQGDSAPLLSSDLANCLFDKAPIEFLETRTRDQLISIVKEGVEFLEDFVASKETVKIDTSALDDKATIWLALGDRPFIVDSVLECFRAHDLLIDIYLHPILTLQDGRKVSLTYIELDQLSDERLHVVRKVLLTSLQDLVLATEDYSSILARIETLIRVTDRTVNTGGFTQHELGEARDFLRWLSSDNFIFLGYAHWQTSESDQILLPPSKTLGICRSSGSGSATLITESSQDAQRIVEQEQFIKIDRLRVEATVHHRVRMYSITVRETAPDGTLSGVHSFAGLLTSRALSEPAERVPLLRSKVQKILDLENAPPNSYDRKNIVSVIDSMPKDEVLRLTVSELREEVRKVLGIQQKSDTRVSLRADDSGRGVSIAIVLPRERFSSAVRHKLQDFIESELNAIPGSSEYSLSLSSKPLARMHFYVPVSELSGLSIEISRLKLQIVELTRSWQDNLRDRILQTEEFSDTAHIVHKFRDAFPDEYQATHSVDECIEDLKVIESLSASSPLRIRLSQTSGKSSMNYSLVIYNFGAEITLSHSLPILENLGLIIINEQSTVIDCKGKDVIHLHRFAVEPKRAEYVHARVFEEHVIPGLTRTFLGDSANDILNSLLLNANLDTRAIDLLRTYCSYLWQIYKGASAETIQLALASEPWAASQLWNMFEIRFNPKLESSIESRVRRFEAAHKTFLDSLRDVPDITKDRILRALADVMANTTRTNFYQEKDTIALKLLPQQIELMPNPRPLFEIFIDSAEMSGVHQRAAKVARGGIRWSERKEDFRQEILGLVKTQTTKNALIVPGGAKGGFVLKSAPSDPKDQMEAVKRAYKTFIRALLSVTDNRVGANVVSPAELVVYDDPDPYLVVAADKGTATFSDTANAIATEEFGFWLGDAFASGGSNGYDHKLYGITARGAWRCVVRHFKDMGLNYEQEPFTAVGIGDMSGDVFGNGLLQSQQVKLIAAFNHKHIFVDPNPDLESSYAERKRLFELPGSQWSDYRTELISCGGGIFERGAKEISLSREARNALGMSEDIAEVLSGEQVISFILQAECDLLWNGGIGTYVKSRSESNAEVNDGANDAVRVNADQLRCRVVGEGGNLGFTQRARIEFAQRGGLINTDAIDNSGGVDLSDHEVNFKILFSTIMQGGELDRDTRDQLLLKIANGVCNKVLTHNDSQALSLTLGVVRSARRLDYLKEIIRDLSRLGYVDRSLEELPDDDVLDSRIQNKESLTRPELAICIASVKRWLKDLLTSSDLLGDAVLQKSLEQYFPAQIVDRYRTYIHRHPLARDIIATEVVNQFIDNMGASFVHRMQVNTGTDPVTITKCFLAARLILDSPAIRDALKRFDTFETAEVFHDYLQEVNRTLQNTTSWLLSHHGRKLTLQEIVDFYRDGFALVLSNADQLLSGNARNAFQLRLSANRALNIKDPVAERLALYPEVHLVLGTVWASRVSGVPIEEVTTVYHSVMSELDINYILQKEDYIEAADKWETELLLHSLDSIRKSVSLLAVKLIGTGVRTPEEVADSLNRIKTVAQLKSYVSEFVELAPSPAAVSVIAREMCLCTEEGEV